MSEELAHELHRRAVVAGRRDSLKHCEVLAHVITTYDVQLKVEAFEDSRGITMKDCNGRTVAVYDVASIEGYVRSEVAPRTDVLVLAEEGMILGWVPRDQTLDTGESWFSLNTKALLPMPKKVFDFSRPCPHLSEFGGWWDDQAQGWECFGCGQLLHDRPIGTRGS